MGPDRGEGWAGQSISHVVSRTVRDSAAILDATTGAEPGNPYEPPHFAGSFLDEVGKDPGKLKIALCRSKLGSGDFSAEVSQAVEQTATMLQGLGHIVEEAEPTYDREAAQRAGFVIIASNIALGVKLREEQLGRQVNDQDIEPSTRFVAEAAASMTASDYARATLVNHQIGRAMGQFHQKYDLILAPTLSREPVPIGFMTENSDGIAQFMGDTALFNQTGQPAVSLPLCWSESGMPLGMMLVAAFGNDALLLRLSGQLEQACPWRDRRAPVHANKNSLSNQ